MSVENKLPEGWVETKLDTLTTDVSYGYTASSTDSPIGPQMLRITDIQDGKVNWESVPYCEIDDNKKSKYLLQKNDLVFARTGATVGKSFLIKEQPPEAVYASYLIRVRVASDELIAMLAHFFNSDSYWRQITEFSAGIGQPNVNGTKLKGLTVPLPPLAEQQVIADQLDSLLAQVEATKTRLERIPDTLKRFRQSVLADAVSGKLTEEWRTNNCSSERQGNKLELEYLDACRHNLFLFECERLGKNGRYKTAINEPPSELSEIPDSWQWISVDALASKVSDGVHKKPNYVLEGIPFVTVKNMTKGRGISFEEINYVTKEDHVEFCKRTNPEKGDILISKDGTLGVVRQIRTDVEFSIFVSVALVKPIVKEMSNYLEFAFQSPIVQQQMVGVGSGLQHIHLTDLRKDYLPIPPLPEQQEIVRRVEQLFAYADRVEQQANAALVQVGQLTRSILAKAFRGELTAGWRAANPELVSGDNSAGALLARIKEERAAVVRSGRKIKAEV
jgi:type I restriction enzyme, S subunit